MTDFNDKFYSRLSNQKTQIGENVPSPLFADILISEKCNLRCRKCYFWKNGVQGEVSIEEYKNFIVSLKDIVKMPFEINLGGGEPFLIDETLDLINFCVKHGFQPAVSTNATLIDDDLAKKISSSGLHRISISLESLNEKTHDFITGVEGSYKKLMRGLSLLRKYWKSGDVNVHTIIAEQNLRDIDKLGKWVSNDGFFTGIAFQALAQPFRTDIIEKWYLDKELGILWPKDLNLLNSIMDRLIDYKGLGYKIINPLAQLKAYKKYYNNPESFARPYRCNSGDYIFNINVFGLVHLCCFMPPIGNIKKNNIKDIWFSEEAKRARNLMRNCQKSCNNILNCYFQEEASEA